MTDRSKVEKVIAGEKMPDDVYIVIGNHRSTSGINEICYCLFKALSRNFPVLFSKTVKSGCINILIDEFSEDVEVRAIEKARRTDPKTKIIIVATEFITDVSILGIKLAKTFNFFGGARDWRNFLLGCAKHSSGYLDRRYNGFTQALQSCDLVVSIHPGIKPGVDDLMRTQIDTDVPSLLLYPEVGSLTSEQKGRFLVLPFGFSMTGTITPYRRRIMRRIAKSLRRVGCYGTPMKETSFRETKAQAPICDTKIDESCFSFGTTDGDFLFNLNPPQSKNWSFSSPMLRGSADPSIEAIVSEIRRIGYCKMPGFVSIEKVEKVKEHFASRPYFNAQVQAQSDGRPIHKDWRAQSVGPAERYICFAARDSLDIIMQAGLIESARLKTIADAYCGFDTVLYGLNTMGTYPGGGMGYAMRTHRDYDDFRFLVFFIAWTRTRQDSGSTLFIPGTHMSSSPSGPTVSLDCKPGDVVAIDAFGLHAGNAKVKEPRLTTWMRYGHRVNRKRAGETVQALAG